MGGGIKKLACLLVCVFAFAAWEIHHDWVRRT